MELTEYIPKYNIQKLSINNISLTPSFKFGIVKKYKNDITINAPTITNCREIYIHYIREAIISKSTVIDKEFLNNIIKNKYIYTICYSGLTDFGDIQTENKKYISTILNIIEKDLGFKQRTLIKKISKPTDDKKVFFLIRTPVEWFTGGPMTSAYLLFIKLLFILGRKKATKETITDLSSFIKNIVIKNKLLMSYAAKDSYSSVHLWENVIKNYNTGVTSTEDIFNNYVNNPYFYGIHREALKQLHAKKDK